MPKQPKATWTQADEIAFQDLARRRKATRESAVAALANELYGDDNSSGLGACQDIANNLADRADRYITLLQPFASKS